MQEHVAYTINAYSFRHGAVLAILQWCEMQIIIPSLAIKYYILCAAAILSEYETPTATSFSTCKNATSIELYWKWKTHRRSRKICFSLNTWLTLTFNDCIGFHWFLSTWIDSLLKKKEHPGKQCSEPKAIYLLDMTQVYKRPSKWITFSCKCLESIHCFLCFRRFLLRNCKTKYSVIILVQQCISLSFRALF